MLSIRMRASKEKRSRTSAFVPSRSHPAKESTATAEIHISGAEGIYDDSETMKVVREYIERASTHTRGEPDRITITIEKVKGRAKMIPSLPVTTLKCISPSEAERHIRSLLGAAGVSGAAVNAALYVVRKAEAMRGASIVLAASGRRVEPDKARGVRASRLGISASAARKLSGQLAGEGIDTTTVKEALILASKVASCTQVVAELCVSDDPDYTTGYVSSGSCGYVRIPGIKRKGSKKGGRVFFVAEDADIPFVKEFIERKPVVINSIGECRGVRSIDEILNNRYR
jgi:6-carboxyhexanoate--CoA ligase